MKKLLLIDGSSMLSTAFFATLPSVYYRSDEMKQSQILSNLLKTSEGKYVNAVYPMTKTLLKILTEQKPTHILVAWDLTRDTFRRDIYKDYKGTREETVYQLKEQFKTMQEVLKKLNIPQAIDKRYEADDFLGSYSKRFQDEIAVSILTKDRDSLQLVDYNTSVWLNTSKAKELNEKYNINKEYIESLPDNIFEFTSLYIEEEYGLSPLELIDLKAIIGDKGDNIPGIKGIGEKTGIPLIKEYKTIENLFDSIRDLSSNKEQKELKEFWKKDLGIVKSPLKLLFEEILTQEEADKLRNINIKELYNYFLNKENIVGEESAIMSKLLGTIKTDIEISRSLDDLEYNIKNNQNELLDILKEYEFKSLMGYVDKNIQNNKNIQNSINPTQMSLF